MKSYRSSVLTRCLFKLSFLCLLPCLFSLNNAVAGGGSENVMIVVNQDSWTSLAIANEYIQLRQIPESNVIYLGGLKSTEYISIDDFRKKILIPILKTIKERNLDKQIDYIIYSSDFPWRVDCRSEVKNFNRMHNNKPFGSLTGLTYLFQVTMAKRPDLYLSLQSNFYARYPQQTKANIKSWPADDTSKYSQAIKLLSEKKKRYQSIVEKFKKHLSNDGKEFNAKMKIPMSPEELKWEKEAWMQIVKILSELTKKQPKSLEIHYNLACGLAALGKPAQAVVELEKAHTLGWQNYRHMQTDKDLASLRKRSDFKELIAKIKKLGALNVPPGSPFKASLGWLPWGRATYPQSGRRYILSTMLGVTSGRGNSLMEILVYLRRALIADGTSPKGTVYLMENKDIRSLTRQWSFVGTVRELTKLGVKAEISQGVLPKDKRDVAGLVAGSPNFNWTKSGSVILPGAICEHLTSFGGVLNSGAGQTPMTEFLRYGAAGTSGTITEPYALQAKFPLSLVQAYYAEGFTLAEAFYQSIAAPFQILILGDPLCQPWGEFPQVALSGLEASSTIKGEVELSPKKGERCSQNITAFILYLDGRILEVLRPDATYLLNTTFIDDGYHELRVVGISSNKAKSQGMEVIPFYVDNNNLELSVELSEENDFHLDGKVKIEAETLDADEIRFYQNERLLATISGDCGEVEIEADKLGLGESRIQALAVFKEIQGEKLYRGTPLHVFIEEPEIYFDAVDIDPSKLKNGILLKQDGQPPIVLPDLTAKTLKQADIQAEKPFSLQAYLHSGNEQIQQLHIKKHPSISEITIDDEALTIKHEKPFSLIPIRLASGWHLMQIKGEKLKRNGYDIRFGARGAHPIAGKRAKHLDSD